MTIYFDTDNDDICVVFDPSDSRDAEGSWFDDQDFTTHMGVVDDEDDIWPRFYQFNDFEDDIIEEGPFNFAEDDW